MMSRRSNLIVGAASLAFIAASFVASTQINVIEGGSDPGPASYPRFILVLLGIAAVGIMLSDGEDSEEDQPRDWRFVLLVFGAIALYIVLLTTIGYILATTLFAAIVLYFAGERRWWLMAIYPIGLALALYFIFSESLSIALPMSFLEELIS